MSQNIQTENVDGKKPPTRCTSHLQLIFRCKFEFLRCGTHFSGNFCCGWKRSNVARLNYAIEQFRGGLLVPKSRNSKFKKNQSDANIRCKISPPPPKHFSVLKRGVKKFKKKIGKPTSTNQSPTVDYFISKSKLMSAQKLLSLNIIIRAPIQRKHNSVIIVHVSNIEIRMELNFNFFF